MRTEDIIKYYGEPGSNQVYCKLPYRMKLAWDTNVSISRFSCHKAVVYNIESIFQEVLKAYGIEEVQKLGLDLFGGCLNIRKKRSGKDLSLHSWGLALDIDPVRNKTHYRVSKVMKPTLANEEYSTFWSIVEYYKGFSMGRQKDYDWMHFQFVPIN